MRESFAVARVVACGVLVTSCAGCASTRAPADTLRTVTVVLSGAPAHTDTAGAALERSIDLPVHVRRAEVPRAAPPPPTFADVSAALALARHQYIDADFRACLATVDDETRLVTLLGALRRDLASRALFWRAACLVGTGDEALALRTARRFAALGLEVPPDVEAATPEVEAVLARAQREVSTQARTEVRLTVDSSTATFAVDGRVSSCGSPCVLELAEGDHVVRVESEGSAPVITTVRAEGPRVSRAIESTPASASIAAEQWSSRYAGTPNVDGASSLRLLSRAVRARDLVFFSVDTTPLSVRLRGAYATDGALRASGERVTPPTEAGVSAASRGLLHELLTRGGTVVERPLYTSPWFWAAIGGATVTTAIVVGVLASPLPIRTEVRF